MVVVYDFDEGLDAGVFGDSLGAHALCDFLGVAVDSVYVLVLRGRGEGVERRTLLLLRGRICGFWRRCLGVGLGRPVVSLLVWRLPDGESIVCAR